VRDGNWLCEKLIGTRQLSRKTKHETKMGKQLWTLEQDKLLSGAVDQEGAKRWVNIAKHIPGKTARQCCRRWLGHIGPYRTDDPWTDAEYLVLAQLVAVEGRRWTIISQQMLGRTAEDVKNKYNSLIIRGRAPYVLSAPRRQQRVNIPSMSQTQYIQKKVHRGTKFTIGSSKISLKWDWW
jgi:hypothetical protein